ncbi:hypothetical protein BDZ45DRAFT_44741 [Acephala macrosclerotiorum]|nr:hypothetical protein BDZ45DRAFT_44741 [Acephala macrosclerotiorum]
MPKGRRYYHKAIAKCFAVAGISHAGLLAIFGSFSLVEVDGTAFKLKKHHPLQSNQHAALFNTTCNVSTTMDYTSHDRFFVYPRFTKGPDIELSKMVASQDQNGYLALPRVSPATTITHDTLNSIFSLTDGQLIVSSLLPDNAENATMYGKVCEVEQDIGDMRVSVPPFTSRSARWRNSSSMISSSSSRTHERFLCHDGQAWNREPARQWQIQQSCVSNKIVDILVPKVAGREHRDSDSDSRERSWV